MKLMIKPRLVDNPKKHLKAYSFLTNLANLFIALSYGLSVTFGMGLIYLSPFWIVIVMGIVAILGSAGKFIKQFDEDQEEDEKT